MNAVITGATKGIGKAIAIKLADAGYNLALCARSQAEIDEFCYELQLKNPSIHALGLATDCSDASSVLAFAEFVQQHFEMVDVLINNVGVFYPGSVLDEPAENFHLQLQVNVQTAYVLSRVFGRLMRKRRSGHIINITSSAAKHPVVEAGSYTVTKYALQGLTHVLRLELMEHGVKVTAIVPGSTLTDSWKGTSIPSDRFVSPQDVADAVILCLSMSAGANPDEIVVNPIFGNI